MPDPTDNLTPPVPTPITVNESAAGGQATAALRNLLVAVGGYIAGKGWIDANIATALVPAVLVLGPMIWSQITVARTHAQRVTMANLLPDSVATVRT